MPADRFRRRCLAAIAETLRASGHSVIAAAAIGSCLMTPSGCKERERHPAPATERKRPRSPAPPPEGECRSGQFCIGEKTGSLALAAAPPHGRCEMAIPLPAGAATELPEKERPMARVVFDSEHTAAVRTGTAPPQPLAGEAIGEVAQSCCYTWLQHCRGRPLLVAGKAQLAPACSRADWIDASAASAVDLTDLKDSERHQLATHWLEEARHEHASIASFARLNLELLALAAPAALLVQCNEAVADELRHARWAFSLASHYAGEALGPGPLGIPTAALALPRERAAALRQLALASYREGCIGESLAAWQLQRTASEAQPILAAALRRIAEEELRHAELAWRIVAWASTHLDEGSRQLLSDDIQVALEEASAAVPPLPRNGTVHVVPRHGLPSTWQRAVWSREALREVVRPCTRVLFGQVQVLGIKRAAKQTDSRSGGGAKQTDSRSGGGAKQTDSRSRDGRCD